jgi:phosphoribosylformimino-5-aminoimidazole carboxamide ribotide isomerase
MIVMPSLDLRGGRCVRLRQGDFARERVYEIPPAVLLRHYIARGVPWVHIVDLDGARDGIPLNLPVVANLARERSVQLQVGGGVRSAATIELLLSAGVARVVLGSVAALRPAETAAWLKTFGADRICLAFDCHMGADVEPYVYTHGWTRSSAISLWDAIGAFGAASLKHVLCTDIGRDGMLRGPNVALYRRALARFPTLAWQASGGVRDAADLATLAQLGLTAAVSGTALVEEHITEEELRPYLLDASSPVSMSVTARS